MYPKEKNQKIHSIYKSSFLRPGEEAISNCYSRDKVREKINKLRCSSINFNVGYKQYKSSMKSDYKFNPIQKKDINIVKTKPSDSYFKIGQSNQNTFLSSNQIDFCYKKNIDCVKKNEIVKKALKPNNKTNICFGFEKNNFCTETKNQFGMKIVDPEEKLEMKKNKEKLDKSNFRINCNKNKTNNNYNTSYNKNFIDFSNDLNKENKIQNDDINSKKTNWNLGHSKRNWETEFSKK